MAATEDAATRTEWIRRPAKDGSDTLVARYRGRERSIYSRIAPRRQALTQIQQLELWDCDVLVCIGLGLGHHLSALVEHCLVEGHPIPKFVGIEPEPQVIEIWNEDPELSQFRTDHFDRIWPEADGLDRLRQYLCELTTHRVRAFVLPHLRELDSRVRNVVESVLEALEQRRESEFSPEAPFEVDRGFDTWIAIGNPLRAYEVVAGTDREDLKERAREAWIEEYERMQTCFELNRSALGSPRVVGTSAAAFEFTGDVDTDLALCGDVAWCRSEEGPSLLVRDGSSWKRLNYGPPPEALGELAQDLHPLVWDDALDFHWLRWFRDQRPQQFLDMRPTVFVVIHAREAFRIALHLEDVSDVLQSLDYYWLIGPNAEDWLRDRLVQRALLPAPSKHFQVQASRSPSPLAWESITAQAATIRERRYQSRQRSTSAYYQRVERANWPRLRSGEVCPDGCPLRVLFVTSRFTTVLQYSIADLSSAFERIGCQVQTLIEADGTERLNHHEFAARIDNFRPDFIVQIDNLRPHFPCVDSRIPYVGWLQDRLPRLFDSQCVGELSSRDFALAMFPSLARQCEDAGYPEVGLLPVAVNDELYHSAPSAVSDASGSAEIAECDVALVSNVRTPSLPGLIPAVEDYCRTRGYGWGDPAHYSELFDWLVEHKNLSVPPESRRAFEFQLYVEFERYLQRIEAVRWAIDAGYRVGLFGAGWDESEEFAPFARGWVEPGEPLRRLYRSVPCHLQINLDTNVHARVFECLASGGVVAARTHPGDREPGGLADHLEVGSEILTFANREELIAIVDRLLAEPAWGESIASAGRRRVLRDHTYRHRARDILERVSQRMRDSYSNGLSSEKGFS